MCKAVADQGYTRPTPIQAQAIPAILEGKDIYAGAQTGTGKTAGFTLPLLQLNAAAEIQGKREVRSLILVPTRELAAQVGESVKKYGAHLPLKSTTVAGGIPMRFQIKSVQRGVDILIATPGRLLDLINRKSVSLLHLNLLVLDEADRMLDMGFMPDIRKILMHVPVKRQTLMFSATSSREIERLSDTILKDPLRIQVGQQNQIADNISHMVYFIARKDKPAALAKLFKSQSWGQALVFTRTKTDADELKQKLLESGLTASVIHGGKPQAVRTQTLKRFKSGIIKILIATDVAARGLDIDMLPHVINYELPQSPDDYVHRIGRTGRAGNKGTAVSLVSQTERHSLTRIEQRVKLTFKREKLEGFEDAWSDIKQGRWAAKSRRGKFDPFRGKTARREGPVRPDRKPYSGDKKPFQKPWDKKRTGLSADKKPFSKPWDKKRTGPPADKKPFSKPWDKKKRFAGPKASTEKQRPVTGENRAFPDKKKKKSFKKQWTKPNSGVETPRPPQKKTGFEKFYKKNNKRK